MRLPQAFAQKLFSETKRGDTVVVADAKSAPMTLAYPAVLAPVNARGQALPEGEAGAPDKAWWDDAAAPSGQVGILVSLHDQRLYVLRDGVMIGESPLKADALPAFQGTTLFVMGQATAIRPARLTHSSACTSGRPIRCWARTAPRPRRTCWPPIAADGVAGRFRPPAVPGTGAGTTLLVTSLPAVRPSAAESGMQPVLESEPPASTLKGS